MVEFGKVGVWIKQFEQAKKLTKAENRTDHKDQRTQQKKVQLLRCQQKLVYMA